MILKEGLELVDFGQFSLDLGMHGKSKPSRVMPLCEITKIRHAIQR
jgi:hypothetical protein